MARSASGFLSVISGERRGPLAAAGRLGLGGLSLFYGMGVRLRNAAYDAGWKRPRRAAVPVVSVGNLTAGGTGKTPIVAHIAGRLRTQGLRVCLISRGYRSLPGAMNDERLVLDRLCPGVPHIQNPDRVAAAKQAVTAGDAAGTSIEAGRLACGPAQVIVLDDAFQHRRLARDLDIVLIDCLNPWGYDRLLPRGLLREPVSALRRADVVVLTRCDLCDDEGRRKIRERVHRWGVDRVVETSFTAERLIDAAGDAADLETLHGKRLLAFCGIGNPPGFAATLRAAGIDIDEPMFQTFPDHHHYGPADLQRMGDLARRHNVEACVTTLKDLVKIPETELGGRPLWALSIRTQFLSGEELLEQRLIDTLAGASVSGEC